MARTRTYGQAALFGAAPVATEFATAGGFGSAGFAPMAPVQPMAEAPAAAAFTGLTFGSLTAGSTSFWRTEAAGFLYFLALAIVLNRRLVNR